MIGANAVGLPSAMTRARRVAATSNGNRGCSHG